MRHYQNTITGEVVSENESGYAAAQKGNWVLYNKLPRYTIETPPFANGRIDFDEDGPLCKWDDIKYIYEVIRRIAYMEASSSEDAVEMRDIARMALDM